MADFASPGIISTERDFSATVQMLGTSTGGTVVNAKWGFVDYEMICANEDELVAQAGKPTDNNFRDWFVAANFLKYTSSLRWARVVDEESALNAAVGGINPAILIKNPAHLEVVKSIGSITQNFAAKCPGDLGSSLSVSMADSATFSTWSHKALFDTAPNSSGPLSGSSLPANDEIHVVVIDRMGLFSGVPGSILEKYAYLSKAADATDVNGASSYYVNALNTRSEYIWGLAPLGSSFYAPAVDFHSAFTSVGGIAGDDLSVAITVVPSATFTVSSSSPATATAVVNGSNIDITFVAAGTATLTLTSGTHVITIAVTTVALAGTPPANVAYVAPTSPVQSDFGKKLTDGKQFALLEDAYTGVLVDGDDGDVPGKDEYIEAFSVLTSSDDTDIALLFAGGCGNDLNQPDISNYVLTTSSTRGDMVGFVSPKFSDIVGVIKTAALNNILATKEALTTKDSFGVMTTGYKLQYDRYNDVNRWIPGNGDDAGLCARAENKQDVWVSPAGFNRGHYVDCISLAYNPNQNARDVLYSQNINPISTFPKDGTLLYGDKTLQAKNSAFSQIGIRRLFNYLRKSIRAAAKYSLFDFNTQFTRQSFKDMIEPILREIMGRNGIVDFFVRCDEKNNTSTVIQRGEFLADIIIKPQYSIQGIRLSFTAVRREVSFDEVIVA